MPSLASAQTIEVPPSYEFGSAGLGGEPDPSGGIPGWGGAARKPSFPQSEPIGFQYSTEVQVEQPGGFPGWFDKAAYSGCGDRGGCGGGVSTGPIPSTSTVAVEENGPSFGEWRAASTNSLAWWNPDGGTHSYRTRMKAMGWPMSCCGECGIGKEVGSLESTGGGANLLEKRGTSARPPQEPQGGVPSCEVMGWLFIDWAKTRGSLHIKKVWRVNAPPNTPWVVNKRKGTISLTKQVGTMFFDVCFTPSVYTMCYARCKCPDGRWWAHLWKHSSTMDLPELCKTFAVPIVVGARVKLPGRKLAALLWLLKYIYEHGDQAAAAVMGSTQLADALVALYGMDSLMAQMLVSVDLHIGGLSKVLAKMMCEHEFQAEVLSGSLNPCA